LLKGLHLGEVVEVQPAKLIQVVATPLVANAAPTPPPQKH